MIDWIRARTGLLFTEKRLPGRWEERRERSRSRDEVVEIERRADTGESEVKRNEKGEREKENK